MKHEISGLMASVGQCQPIRLLPIRRGWKRYQPDLMQHHGRVEGQDHGVLQEVAEGPFQVYLCQVLAPAGAGRGG